MPDIGWVDADNPVLNQLDAAASRYGVDRNLVHTVAQMESAYNPRAVSGAGAQGVMQLMPATASDLGVKDPFDPAQNIDGGVRYLRNLSQKYGGDNRLVLAAYNAGPGAVDRAGGVPDFKETKNYVNNGISILGSRPKSAAGTPDIGWEDATPAPETLTLQATVKTPQNVQILPPLSEPPGSPQPEEKSVEGFLNNLTTSAYNNLLSPIVHPGQTLAGISNLLEGMGEMTGNKPVPGMHGRQAIEGLTNLYTGRYGSWQGFKDAWYKDPVGMLGDLAIAADGLGLGKAAAQDFIRASGLTDAATAARDTLAGAVPNMGKVGAATTAGVKAVPGAAMGAFKKAFDPALILSGPHSMVIGAKLEFAKQVAKAARDAWKGAGEAPEVAGAAAEAAPAVSLTPEEQAFREQFRPPPAAPVTPPDLAGQAAQASMSPRVMLRSEAAQAFPEFYGQPAPAAEPQAAPLLTPQDLTELQTGRPPSRQSATAQQTAAETLATAQAAAPPAAPVAPEAPPAAQTVPPVPEAPTGPLAAKPQAADIARQLEDMTRADRVSGFLKANFPDLAPADIDKFDAHDWELIGKGSGGSAPTAEQIAEVKASVAKAAEPVPREVAKMPPAKAEAAVAPKLRKPPAEALAEMMPESAAPPPAPGPPAPTAPEVRIETLAQHFAKDTEMTPEAVAAIAKNPDAARLLEKLSDSLGIKGRPAPGEIRKIANRVRELRRGR